MCVRVLCIPQCAGFNKRVVVALHHPVITAIVDRSGTSLCAAGNHGGQGLTSELHSPAVQDTAYFNTRLCPQTLCITHTVSSICKEMQPSLFSWLSLYVSIMIYLLVISLCCFPWCFSTLLSMHNWQSAFPPSMCEYTSDLHMFFSPVPEIKRLDVG